MNALELDDQIERRRCLLRAFKRERVPTARETFPALQPDGTFEFAEQLVDLDPLLFNGKVKSAFTRLSFTELANGYPGGELNKMFR